MFVICILVGLDGGMVLIILWLFRCIVGWLLLCLCGILVYARYAMG